MTLKQTTLLSIFILSSTIYISSCTYKTPSALGTWVVMIENGKDVSKSQVTYTITKNSISQSVPKVCKETSTLSMTAHAFTTVTTQSNCPWSFPGKKNSGVMSFKGDLLTLTFPEHGKNFSQTLRKQ